MVINKEVSTPDAPHWRELQHPAKPREAAAQPVRTITDQRREDALLCRVASVRSAYSRHNYPEGALFRLIQYKLTQIDKAIAGVRQMTDRSVPATKGNYFESGKRP